MVTGFNNKIKTAIEEFQTRTKDGKAEREARITYTCTLN